MLFFDDEDATFEFALIIEADLLLFTVNTG
jgi:hypothetical protein